MKHQLFVAAALTFWENIDPVSQSACLDILKAKVHPKKALKAQGGTRGIAVPFL
jgi:hypothetical protein